LEGPLLTVSGVAELLAVSERMVYYLVADQGLPAIRVGKQTLRFDSEAVRAWLAARAVSGGA
jgi:excisionase family DNA binding protein